MAREMKVVCIKPFTLIYGANETNKAVITVNRKSVWTAIRLGITIKVYQLKRNGLLLEIDQKDFDGHFEILER